ncbi:MAG: segregation/condensation protein A [Candidatus Bilamarchaeaceae archaeon]
MATSLNLETIVIKPTWKEVLSELIVEERLDPWDIDIIAIADGFMRKVRQMQKLDLIVPANIILASAILLKYKSQIIVFQDANPLLEAMEEAPLPYEEAPQLGMVSRFPPKRPISLDEFVEEIEKVIKYETKDTTKKTTMLDFIDWKIHKVDIDRKMDEVMESILKSTDGEGWTMFSRVADGKTERIERIYAFLAMLHLAQKQRIELRQDELFDEIFIKVLDATPEKS